MVPRDRYLEKLIAFRDADVIKVVTGMRRCGKSTLLDMMRKHLEDNGVPSECLLTFKMESFELEGVRDWRELYRHVDGQMPAGKRCYLFFDELQEVAGWESVRELVANVNTRYQEACVKDEALKNLKDMLDGKTSVPSSEKSSEENTSESVSETVYDAESQADEA